MTELEDIASLLLNDGDLLPHNQPDIYTTNNTPYVNISPVLTPKIDLPRQIMEEKLFCLVQFINQLKFKFSRDMQNYINQITISLQRNIISPNMYVKQLQELFGIRTWYQTMASFTIYFQNIQIVKQNMQIQEQRMKYMRALRQEMQPASTPVHQTNYLNSPCYSPTSPESNILCATTNISTECSASTPKENSSTFVPSIKFPTILPGVSPMNPIRVDEPKCNSTPFPSDNNCENSPKKSNIELRYGDDSTSDKSVIEEKMKENNTSKSIDLNNPPELVNVMKNELSHKMKNNIQNLVNESVQLAKTPLTSKSTPVDLNKIPISKGITKKKHRIPCTKNNPLVIDDKITDWDAYINSPPFECLNNISFQDILLMMEQEAERNK